MLRFKQLLSEKILGTSGWIHSPRQQIAVKMLKKHDTLSKAYSGVGKDGSHSWAIRRYSLNSSNINKGLHTGHMENEHDQKTAEVLEKAISNHPAPHGFHVYSGIRGNPFNGYRQLPSLKKNNDGSVTGHLPAFTSTSIHPKQPEYFSNTDDRRRMHMLKIHIPKGSTHGAYIGHVSEHGKKEMEYLLKPNKRIRIHPRPEIVHGKTMEFDKQASRYGEKPTKTFIWHAHIED